MTVMDQQLKKEMKQKKKGDIVYVEYYRILVIY